MKRPSQRTAYWAIAGAILGALLSIVAVYFPPELGGYLDWDHPDPVFHNAGAVFIRIIIFALIGAALAGSWHHHRRRTRR